MRWLALAVLAASPAGAQDAAPPCELHVWPADAAKSFTTVTDIDWGISEVQKYSRDPLNPLTGTRASVALQAAVFERLDLPVLLNLPGHAVVLHDTPLPSRVIRATRGRILPDSAPCYAELITDDVFFQEDLHADFDLLNKGVLNTTFRFRRFDGGDSPVFSYGSFVTSDLYEPGKRVSFTPASAIARFEIVFAESVTEFAEKMHAAGQARDRGKKRK